MGWGIEGRTFRREFQATSPTTNCLASPDSYLACRVGVTGNTQSEYYTKVHVFDLRATLPARLKMTRSVPAPSRSGAS